MFTVVDVLLVVYHLQCPDGYYGNRAMVLKSPWKLIFFPLRLTNYNLRGSGLNVVQKPHNSLVMHISLLYKIAHMWNKLSAITKSSSTLAQFHSRLNGVEFPGRQCVNRTF